MTIEQKIQSLSLLIGRNTAAHGTVDIFNLVPILWHVCVDVITHWSPPPVLNNDIYVSGINYSAIFTATDPHLS